MISIWWVFPFLAVGGLIGWMWRGILADRDEALMREARDLHCDERIDALTARYSEIVKRSAEPVVPDNGGET